MADSTDLARRVRGRLSALSRQFGPRMVAGVSGGGDSLALAAILAAAARDLGLDVAAVCVDHGIQRGSAGVATEAAERARALGLDASTVTLCIPDGARLQERARDARHASLAEAAVAFDARLVLLAHTLEDQAETLAQRIVRGTGPAGLAGMAPVTVSPAWRSGPPVLVARPLLDETRLSLRKCLLDLGVGWHDDPANSDPAFTRAAIRARLAALEPRSSGLGRLARLAGLAAHVRQTVRDAAWDLVSDVVLDDVGVALPAAPLRMATPATANTAIGALIQTLGGAARPPAPSAVARLREALLGEPARAMGAGGVHLSVTKGWLRAQPERRRGVETRSFTADINVLKAGLAAALDQADAFVKFAKQAAPPGHTGMAMQTSYVYP